MDNEETKQVLFEAFSAGDYRVNNEHPKESLKQRFEAFLARRHPNLLMPSKVTEAFFDGLPSFDNGSGKWSKS